MNDCFYRRPFWEQDFFTPGVKSQGNLFAVFALTVALAGISYILFRRTRYFARIANEAPARSFGAGWLWFVAVFIVGVCVAYYSRRYADPSADEIFSAVNCAELPWFQTLSYYMLPNNHVYFNLVNGMVAKLSGIDGVVTGRTLSMLAYAGVLCCIFYILKQLLQDYLLAIIALAPIVFQFTPWAFGFQARGYELQLLCGWVAFLTMRKYTDMGGAAWLRANTMVCIVGFALIPTFLYYWAAQAVFVLISNIRKRHIITTYWKYQVYCLLTVFIMYLPALGFSGLHSLTANDYVKAAQSPLIDFLKPLVDVIRTFINHIFSFLVHEDHPLIFVLFLSPLLLFLSKKKGDRDLGTFYVVLWLVWLLICVSMRRQPFSRNMVLHYSFTLVLAVYSIFVLIRMAAEKVRSVRLRLVLLYTFFSIPAVSLAVEFCRWGIINANFFLYSMDVSGIHKAYITDQQHVPANSSIVCSGERYCMYYYFRKGPYRTVRCPTGNEDYFLICGAEELPAILTANYTLMVRCPDGDDIYKHK